MLLIRAVSLDNLPSVYLLEQQKGCLSRKISPSPPHPCRPTTGVAGVNGEHALDPAEEELLLRVEAASK